jgi:hypothetical protein
MIWLCEACDIYFKEEDGDDRFGWLCCPNCHEHEYLTLVWDGKKEVAELNDKLEVA